MNRDNSQSGPYQVRFIKPPNKLKQKVGNGGIDETLIDKAQKYVETAELDFLPYAKQFLKELSDNSLQARKSNDNLEKAKDKLIGPVMQLKANGGMFKYQLVSDVADIALQFLEAIDKMDEDAFDVIKAHENTILVIINNNLRGDGGREGYALVKELHKACKRYFVKHKIDGKG